ncbi:hypothetical protein EYF80_054121 [Liparis tanakae]|uniref:Uncharacterized protein n=1 Tax=Liparis tanakae TaxID=230148 RepID=A0A4Z2F4R7_9TELE|nr:hypothetical protein EYF80_054121 [Liparis tanakae]
MKSSGFTVLEVLLSLKVLPNNSKEEVVNRAAPLIGPSGAADLVLNDWSVGAGDNRGTQS